MRMSLVVTRRASVIALVVSALLATGCAKRQPATPSATNESRRVTVSGPVVGYQGDYGNHVWRGIPYAKAPVGELRWRGPQPPEPWTETREALVFSDSCVQYASPFGGIAGADGSVGGSEDCLYLNVYAPRVGPSSVPTGNARWPVMVWIHRGAAPMAA